MSSTLSGRVALVTGGNRGLGRALVDELLARGAAKVYATSRSAHTHPDARVVPVVLDVTDADQVAAAAVQAHDVDLVVSNAGSFTPAPVLSADLDALRQDFETNVVGLLHVARSFAPVLARSDRGSLLSVLSVVSWFSAYGGYGVSKAAALSATDAIRLELAGQGTTVSGLMVGYMETDMVRDLDVPKTPPADIARAALDGVAAGELQILADDAARFLASQLGSPVTERYPELHPA